MSKKSEQSKPINAWLQALLVVIIPVLGLAPFVGWTYYQNTAKMEQERTERVAQQRQDLRNWPMVAAPDGRSAEERAQSIHLDMSTLPPLPPATDPNFFTDLREWLKWVVTNHPTEEIRNDLAAAIEAGEISINFQANAAPQSVAAAFATFHRSEVSFTEIEREWYPALMVNPLSLTEIATEEGALSVMLVIYHEYQHYKQYLEQVREHGVAHGRWGIGGQREMTHDQGFYILSKEHEAYTRECQLAASWGFDASILLGSMCDYVDSPAMGQLIFHATVSTWGGLRQIPKTFVAGMAKAAEHPQPDVYLD